MPFSYDSRGIKPSEFSGPIPEGTYTVQIVKTEEKASKNNDPMIFLTLTVQEPQEFAGAPLYHYVTFLPKGSPGAGIAIHFLKTIGEPWEEEETLVIDPDSWSMKKFKCRVVQEPYFDKSGEKRISNKIKAVSAVDKADIPF